MARLYLDAGSVYGIIGSFAPTDVIGTNDSETVYVSPNGKAIFDPSFNRGGDEIVIQGDSSFYSAALVGSSILITNDNNASIRIPVGTAGATVSFEDGSFDLLFNGTAVVLGDQVINATSTALDLTPPPAAIESLSAVPLVVPESNFDSFA